MAFPITEALDLDFTGAWLTVWFNEPETRNALTAARSAEIIALCAALTDRRDIRGVTFRGRGGVFCAGGDLRAFQATLRSGDRDAVIALSLRGAELFKRVNELPQIVIMAIEGAAIAGGLGLACCGDVVIAEAAAKFALSEVRIGLTPAQISPFVIERLGAPTARRLMLTGARLNAAEAQASGLVDTVAFGATGVDEAVETLRADVMGCAPGAVAATKALIREMPALDKNARAVQAAESFADAMLSDEGREGVTSFAEKRRPRWAT